MNGQSDGVQTVERALIILNSFSNEEDSWGITDLSHKLGLSKSVVHRILTSMHKYGYVEKDVQTDKYRLGIKVIELGKIAANQMDLRKLSFPIMQNLAEITGESVLLTKREGKTGVGIAIIEGSHSTVIRASFGIGLPLHCGASKKVLLAFQNSEFINNYLENEKLNRLSDQIAIDKQELLEELARIREEGIAVTSGDVDNFSTGIAAPIYDYNGIVVASIGVSGRSLSFRPEKIDSTVDLVKQAANEISLKLGYPYASP